MKGRREEGHRSGENPDQGSDRSGSGKRRIQDSTAKSMHARYVVAVCLSVLCVLSMCLSVPACVRCCLALPYGPGGEARRGQLEIANAKDDREPEGTSTALSSAETRTERTGEKEERGKEQRTRNGNTKQDGGRNGCGSPQHPSPAELKVSG